MTSHPRQDTCFLDTTVVLAVVKELVDSAGKYGCSTSIEAALTIRKLVNQRGLHGNTPLMLAAKNGHLAVVNELLEAGAEINLSGRHGCSALMLAAEHGHAEILKLLLNKGANLHQTSPNCSALILAAENGHIESAEILIEAGAKIDQYFRYPYRTFLTGKIRSTSTYNAYTAFREFLIDKINPALSYTALMGAAGNGHTEMVKLLLDRGADVNQQDKYSMTALIWASAQGHTETVKILLANGANPGLKSICQTALIAAAENGHTETIEALLDGGADPAQRGGPFSDDESLNLSYDALEIAADHGHLEAAKILINHLVDNRNINLEEQIHNWLLTNSNLEAVQAELIQYYDDLKMKRVQQDLVQDLSATRRNSGMSTLADHPVDTLPHSSAQLVNQHDPDALELQ